MSAKPHLSIVSDQHDGEILCSACIDRERALTELTRKMRGLAAELGALREEKLHEAEADKLWPTAVRLFEYHNRVLKHPGAEWNLKRFMMARRELRKKAGLERCLRAIAGKASDDWARSHGHTTFDDVFETAKKFEKCLARCPKDWKPPRNAGDPAA